MLPGFRFLFAAIMLSMSLLVFGLGAASLLRAAHQVFAGNPTWLGAPEMTFAHRGDANPLVLAALRVDPSTIERAASEPTDVITSSSVEAAQQVSTEPAAAQIAAPNPSDTPPMEIAKTDGAEVPAAGNLPAADVATAGATVPSDEAKASTAGETRIAVLADLNNSQDKNGPTIAEPNPASSAQPDSVMTTSPIVAPEASGAESKLAGLGGPPVEIVPLVSLKEPAAKPEQAKSDQSVIKKRVLSRRAARRRRLAAARARLAAQQLLFLQQANPFALALQAQPPAPAPVPLPARRQRSR
jgi:hypothetical protein